jgi:SAM-dependent methyltransferase
MTSIISSFINGYNNLSTIGKILMFCVLLLCIIAFFKYINKYKINTEHFTQNDEFIFKEGVEVYDDFYADIYDLLVYSNIKNDYEIGQIVKNTKPTHESIILDVGSASGHHVADLAKMGLNVTGIDNSNAMIKKAQELYPEYNFVKGDVLNAEQFRSESYTHILCLYFTIYYFKNKEKFFKNCFNWLHPGGYLVIHLVDRDMFDPIIPPANPLMLLTPQRYAKSRITTSSVVFNDFKYDSNFEIDKENDSAIFIEKFKNKKSGKVFRKQEHKMYMETEDAILQLAQEVGFIIEGKIDLIKAGYEYNTLYVLTKPN